MSEENKQEKVKVKIQGREFELTKLPNGRYSGEISFKIGDIENKIDLDATPLWVYKDGNISGISFHTDSSQKISFKIGDIENKDKQASDIVFWHNGYVKKISFKEPQPISFKIGDIENKDKQASSVGCDYYDVEEITFINFKEPQPISFKIGDIENSNIEVSRISLIEDYEGSHIREIIPLNNQKISFKIGDIKNENIEVNMIIFDKNGSPQYILLKENQKISFKIGDIENSNIEVSEISFHHGGIYTLRLQDAAQIGCYINNKKCMIFITNAFPKDKIIFFPDGRTLKQAMLFEDITLNVKFHGKDYDLPFKNREDIFFNDNEELSQSCIDNSSERSTIVYVKERLNEIEKKTTNLQENVADVQNKQEVAMKQDRWFIGITGGIGLLLVAFALGLCVFLPKNFDKMSFVYLLSFLDPKHETFNKYTFLYEILKRTPIIVLIILGFKFLQLAFERLRLIGKVEQVRNYIALTADDDTKKQLLKMIAIPFFAPKKVKSRFFDRLIDKTSINIGSERESGGVISKEQKEQAVKLTSDDGVCGVVE